jgi:hypothetical protein
MSYSPGIGLILGLDIDSSGASAEIEDFDNLLDDATEKWNHDWQQSTKGLDEGLLSNRESVRLLTEELGIHLPRAVTGAISEMMPAIGGLGSALLGVFAVEEVVKYVSWVHKLVDEENDVAASEAAIHEAVEANNEIFEKLARSSIKAAQEQLRLADIRLLAAQSEVEHQRDVNEGLDWAIPQNQALVGLYHSLFGETKDLKEAEKQLKDVQELRGKIAAILLEGEIKGHEKAEEAAKKRAAAEARRAMQAQEEITRMTEFVDRLDKERDKWYQAWLKSLGMPEEVKFSIEEVTREINSEGRAAAAALPSLKALSEAHVELTAAQRAALPTDQEIKKVYEELLRLRPDLTAAEAKALAQQLAEEHAIAAVTRESGNQKVIREQLTAAILKQLVAEGQLTQEHARQLAAANGVDLANKKLIVGFEQLKDVADAFAKSTKDGLQALESDTEALQEVGGEISQLIGSRKAQAEIEGGFDAAKAIEEMAIFIASGGTDGAALLASVKYGLASAEYFKVAGRGGGSSAGGSGGGGGSASRVGGQTGPMAAGAIGTEVPIQPGLTSFGGGAPAVPGGTLHIMVVGEAEKSKFIVDAINTGVTRYGMQVNTGTRPKAGR